VLDNLPIGVYVAGRSPVHLLRARTKLLVLVWLSAIFFLANHKRFHFGTFSSALLLLGAALVIAGVRPRYLWRRTRFLLLLLAFTIPFTLIWIPGPTWRTFGPFVVTYDGIWLAISFTAIFLLLFLGSLVLSLTTSPVALAEAIVLLLRPLRRLRLPIDEFGLMTLVALRFIPVLVQEAEQLVKAQISRGADFNSGSLPSRLRAASTLLVPLLGGALRRAEHLGAALDSRGYGVSGQATVLHELPLAALDWAVLLGVPLVTLLAYLRL
jgi:energy-coupling factor transport system permease protein